MRPRGPRGRSSESPLPPLLLAPPGGACLDKGRRGPLSLSRVESVDVDDSDDLCTTLNRLGLQHGRSKSCEGEDDDDAASRVRGTKKVRASEAAAAAEWTLHGCKANSQAARKAIPMLWQGQQDGPQSQGLEHSDSDDNVPIFSHGNMRSQFDSQIQQHFKLVFVVF